MIKKSYIKKIKGKYSRKGRTMGTYDSLGEAKKRLGQIEYFKKASEEITYSFFMRFLNKNHKRLVIPFMKIFFKNFNEGLAKANDDLFKFEKIILKKSIQELLLLKEAGIKLGLIKKASGIIQMGDAEVAGKRLADIIKFMLKRIKPESRHKVYNSMKEKILKLSPDEISSKKTPATSAMGQAITFLKTVLIGNESSYIREILLNIAKNMG